MTTRIVKRLAVAVALTSLAGCNDSSTHRRVDNTPDIAGAVGTAFALTARAGFISMPDGASIPMWGFASNLDDMQYPGPTLIVEEGADVTVSLTNQLTVPVSIVFPGQQVTASGGTEGELAREAAPGQTITYSFRADHPGTFTYYSGSQGELQIEMGLVGALIVRPTLGAGYAYNHPATAFDEEFLFLQTEIDPVIHDLAAAGDFAAIDFSARWPVYWLLNGRAAPDTMMPDYAGWLPNQPYGCNPHMMPGERLLMRVVNAGHDLHPFHHHGNHARVLANNGVLLESQAGSGPDLAHDVFTIQAVPGETTDAIFQWTGEKLGWDIYGLPSEHPHTCVDGDGDTFDDTTMEYCPDHGKRIPVSLPQELQLTFGGYYSGSPFLGVSGLLPPGEGGNNPEAAFTFMWHSHTEREMTNDDIFPGGMMTMLMVHTNTAQTP